MVFLYFFVTLPAERKFCYAIVRKYAHTGTNSQDTRQGGGNA